MNEEELHAYFNKLREGQLTKSEFDQFQEWLKDSPELRRRYRQAMRLNSHLSDMAMSFNSEQEAWLNHDLNKSGRSWFLYSGWAAAAACLILFIWPTELNEDKSMGQQSVTAVEEMTKGVAVITDAVDVEWENRAYQPGQAVGPEMVEMKKGLVKIEFYCGATLVLEGPAKLEALSAWKAVCHRGKLRAHVPPAARGFSIMVDKTEVVDLGTEFTIDANGVEKQIQVFDGEVALHSAQLKDHRLTTGKTVQLRGNERPLFGEVIDHEFMDMSDLKGMSERRDIKSYNTWLEQSQKLAQDSRLLVYYNFLQNDFHRRILENQTQHGKERSGAIVGADIETGRWGKKSALSFKQPGDRVRLHIPGEHRSLTMMCWVKIYSLDREWNSLYLTDNYQVGECHWQIMRDGRLMFSTKIREGWDSENKVGAHTPHFSPSIWKPELRGRWIHLAVRLDVENQMLTHFFNGQVWSRHPSQVNYELSTTRLGNGEIGNWGLPNKPDVAYAIRNLNGAIDEFAIFSAALSDEEIEAQFLAGNPYQ